METIQILIIGAGTAGITAAATLRRREKGLQIAIIDPSDTHYYQPAWTLVGAGVYSFRKTGKPIASLIPKGVKWIKERVNAINADKKVVETENGGKYTYEYLILAPGMTIAPEMLPGLHEGLEKGVVTSIYIDPEKTRESIQNFKSGNALFSLPPTPIKCGGAPQKIMYLAEHYFRKHQKRKNANVLFATPAGKIFGVEDFAETLNKIVIERDIMIKPFYTPVKIDPVKKEVYFKISKRKIESGFEPDGRIGETMVDGDTVKIPFDLLHLAPPQKPPVFVSESAISYQEGKNKGWAEVDVNTLQHPKYPTVFALGDIAALPTAKTGAAIRKQVPVVVGNILHLIKEQRLGHLIYEGYTSCPLVTGYGKMVLAEFKYDNERDSDPIISRLMDTAKESYLMWLLKKYMLPVMYWKMMLKGRV